MTHGKMLRTSFDQILDCYKRSQKTGQYQAMIRQAEQEIEQEQPNLEAEEFLAARRKRYVELLTSVREVTHDRP